MACGMASISALSPAEKPFCTRALKPPMKSTPVCCAHFSSVSAYLSGSPPLHADEHGDRRDRYPLIDDGNAIFPADVIAYLDQILSHRGDLAIYLLTGTVDVRICAVKQRDPHSDRADVEILLIDHLDGFQHIL